MCALFDPPEPRRVSPGEYPAWDQALALLNRDLAATLPQLEPLQLLALPSYDAEEPENVYVAMANGEWHGNCLDPNSQASLASALASVADAAQETVMELSWQAWPLCPEHGLGMHPMQDAQERLFWRCAGERLRRGPAHFHAAVGALDASGTSIRTQS
ncbi:hypothetical protein HUT05_22745 [Streptomyces chartreusis]|uniref:Uncharacterized protein n=1 Tax=Streptomyces chartreusis TaxID=1969 RepID=A0A7H8TD43_STRCX|nr:hypothetical protein [Streptomyces chartreusis]QKZ19930.1 hypothetical protein HUT05_22745 [Streptomyces chartreusis]